MKETEYNVYKCEECIESPCVLILCDEQVPNSCPYNCDDPEWEWKKSFKLEKGK